MYSLRLVFIALSAQLLANLGVEAHMVRFNISKRVDLAHGPQRQRLISYYANIGVGTPPKEFKMLVDINSRENFLPHYAGVGLHDQNLNYEAGYANAHSSSGVAEQDEYRVAHHITQLAGRQHTDVFELRNVIESIAPAKFRQRFLAISSASNFEFMVRWLDGVIAINPWPVSETGSELMSVSLKRAQLIVDPVVGMSLDQDVRSEFGGELTFGGVNRMKFLGEPRYHQSVNQFTWHLNLTSVMLGRDTIGCADGRQCTALISTTTNDIYGPPDQVKKVLKYFGHSSVDESFDRHRLYDVDCLVVTKAPIITFIIDDAQYTVNPSAYIRKTEWLGSGRCYIAIFSNGLRDQWELGTNFLANYYTIFNITRREVALTQPRI